MEEEAEVTPFVFPGLALPINVLQERSKGIGFQLWPAATFLCRFLASAGGRALLPKPIEECNILELGAGVGLGKFFFGAGFDLKAAIPH